MAPLHPAAQKIFDALAAAAEADQPAPRSHDLAKMAGIAGSRACAIVQQLDTAGLIVIERRYAARRFTIVTTGARTAWPYSVLHRAETLAVPLPPRVDRDPCPRCNVRGDIGCAHQVRPWMPGDGVLAA